MLMTSVSPSSLAVVEDFVISGYISAGVATTRSKNATFLLADHDIRFDTLTHAAIQFTAPVKDDTSFTLQLSAHGIDKYEPKVGLAFLNFSINEYYDLRIGKLRIPFFMISDYIDTGYTYPWVIAPIDVYIQTGFTEFEGLDLIKRQQLGRWSLAIQGIFGSGAPTLTVNNSEVDIIISKVIGINFTMSKGSINLRAGRVQGDFDIINATQFEAALQAFSSVDDDLGIIDRRGIFSGIGFSSEHKNVVIMGEYTWKETNSIIADTTGWYAMLGYNFGSWMPHLTYSSLTLDEKYDGLEALKVQTPIFANAIDAFILMQTQTEKSFILGLRHEFKENTALKFEIQHIKLGNNSVGVLQNVIPGLNSINVYSFVFDSIF